MAELECREENGKIYLEGVINERWDFTEFLSGKSSPLTLHMKKVKRINSTGVRRWTEALYQYPNMKIVLEHCPREIVDQCNMIPEFLGNRQVRVVSFYAHYYSEDEDTEEVVLFEEGTHYTWGEGVTREPPVPEGMQLDDNPKKYFRFLTYFK